MSSLEVKSFVCATLFRSFLGSSCNLFRTGKGQFWSLLNACSIWNCQILSRCQFVSFPVTSMMALGRSWRLWKKSKQLSASKSSRSTIVLKDPQRTIGKISPLLGWGRSPVSCLNPTSHCSNYLESFKNFRWWVLCCSEEHTLRSTFPENTLPD